MHFEIGDNMHFEIKQIGIIHSPFKKMEEAPIQPRFSDKPGKIEVFPEYKEGLKDLEGFSHIILLYYFHLVKEEQLTIRPFMEPDKPKGVFATRYNKRPNKIGLSICEIDRIEDNIIYVKYIDVLDNTPLIDIKPLVPLFDFRNIENIKVGWLSNKKERPKKIINFNF
ncbi:MAG: tRNA (N6-threonylcarbamoyladenosine(37)-N6)-methyltransferase TrmO [Candidatus Heimdallarchaeaceae archaeon]